MKIKKYILAGSLAVLLSTTAVSTLNGNKAEASSQKDYLIQSQFHDKKIAEELKSLLRQSNVYDLAAGSLNRYYKRTIMMNEYRAKAALKKNDFKSMAEAKVGLENIYKEIDEIINR
ncbi:TPA: complement inhibitor SCIN family protein [Staphylococcus aureus]|uniref:complement inhibitor SCIN family protein n=1 Tax=Staphylococcus aureus TaxID=1280 RepID=UPI00208E718C|nr:complement inhibitor SCIN family protein [Staphylococcus aureus]MCO4428220.1 fibrinogen-binding protein [Staphylococcus aureus]MEB6833584.1 complement inhibitor SCIN [Staphylococcus aureus]UXU27116.1 complement inhibitor SCIN [Staphylococcus aureus]HCD1989847.1 complement inhibitor SCIN family protein [Staphylococcus aureus]HCX9225403.1 complement inhibitor SCIN family protein [Staphylococcus aureus]